MGPIHVSSTMPSSYKIASGKLPQKSQIQDQNHRLNGVTDTTAAPKPSRDGVRGQKEEQGLRSC